MDEKSWILFFVCNFVEMFCCVSLAWMNMRLRARLRKAEKTKGEE